MLLAVSAGVSLQLLASCNMSDQTTVTAENRTQHNNKYVHYNMGSIASVTGDTIVFYTSVCAARSKHEHRTPPSCELQGV